MKFKIPVEGGDDDINMAPMIDMVFLLLIFFMVASQMTKIDRVEVELPVADKAIIPEAAVGRQMITIRSNDAGVGEDITIYMFGKELSSVEEVTPFVRARLSQNKKLKVYLRADRYVKHKHVKDVMAACAEAGISEVIFATFESGN